MRLIFFLVMAFWTTFSIADLYRWVDPESGSVKFTSLPPPWYGDPEKERRAPKVQVIPSGTSKPAATPPAPGAAPGSSPAPAAASTPEALGALERRFKGFLQTFAGLPTDYDYQRAGAGFQQQMQAYRDVSVELDRLDPKGAARRRAESQPVLGRFVESLRRQLPAMFSAPPPQAAKPQSQ